MKAFLAAIRILPNISKAARAADIRRCQHYKALETNPRYKAAFEKAYAIGVQAVVDVAVERATDGWDEPIVYQGGFTYPLKLNEEGNLVHDYSAKPLTLNKIDNRLLVEVLQALAPAFKKKAELEVAGAGGGPIAIRVEFVAPTPKP